MGSGGRENRWIMGYAEAIYLFITNFLLLLSTLLLDFFFLFSFNYCKKKKKKNPSLFSTATIPVFQYFHDDLSGRKGKRNKGPQKLLLPVNYWPKIMYKYIYIYAKQSNNVIANRKRKRVIESTDSIVNWKQLYIQFSSILCPFFFFWYVNSMVRSDITMQR